MMKRLLEVGKSPLNPRMEAMGIVCHVTDMANLRKEFIEPVNEHGGPPAIIIQNSAGDVTKVVRFSNSRSALNGLN